MSKMGTLSQEPRKIPYSKVPVKSYSYTRLHKEQRKITLFLVS